MGIFERSESPCELKMTDNVENDYTVVIKYEALKYLFNAFLYLYFTVNGKIPKIGILVFPLMRYCSNISLYLS